MQFRPVNTHRSNFLWVLAAALLAPFTADAQPELRPEYRSIAPGLDYAHIQMKSWSKDEPWSIHVARLDRSEESLRVASALAYNRVFGTAPISAIAKSIPATKGKPLVLINTGFCINRKDPYLGNPRGLVITDGELVSAPSRYSFWANEDGSMHFGTIEAKFTVTIGGKKLPIGLNDQCRSNDVVLFTHVLGNTTRATNQSELVLENAEQSSLSWRAGGSYSLRVKAVNPSGNTALSNTVAVLTFGPDADIPTNVRVGDNVKVELKTTPDLAEAVTGTECIFPIVQNGKVLIDFEGKKKVGQQSYILLKHPRTAIGFNERFFFMVVVDGRQKELSTGMFAEELGQLMIALGCTEAMNMDGGGSSTFWADGKTRNSVAGSRERDRADALVILKKPLIGDSAAGQ